MFEASHGRFDGGGGRFPEGFTADFAEGANATGACTFGAGANGVLRVVAAFATCAAAISPSVICRPCRISLIHLSFRSTLDRCARVPEKS